MENIKIQDKNKSEIEEIRRNLEFSLKKFIAKKNNKSKPIYNLCTPEIYNLVANSLAFILKSNEPQNRIWNFNNNRLNTELLAAWFCMDKEKFDEIAIKIGNPKLSILKDIYLCGIKGSGKSSTISALNEFTTNHTKGILNAKYRSFMYVEQNKIANTYELEGNINKYTFNQQKDKFADNPRNIILDDLKFSGLTKSFGTDFRDLITRFLYDRYSLWLMGESNTIITSLLTPSELKKELPTDLFNRFEHQYNLITFKVTERK